MQTSKNEAEVRVRVRRNPRRALSKLVLIFISIYFILLTYNFVHALVVTRLARVETISRGVVQSTVPVQGILVRDEILVTAPQTGLLKVIAPEGERVRVGQVIAQVVAVSLDSHTGEKSFNITSPRAGIVSYHLDGLEEVYSWKNINELDLEKVQTIPAEVNHVLPGSQVEEGKPVFKIVNNLEPVFIIADTSVKLKSKDMEKGSIVLLLFGSDENNVSRAVLSEKIFGASPDRMLLSLSNYTNSLLTPRTIEFQVITERYDGFYIPVGAIVRKEGKDGIFTVYKERVRWKDIEIKARVGDKAIINDVTADLKVVSNPQYVKEGFPIKLP
ncbi:HlyD family efflux transporter periplasmic adaptor subunit [Phosphitispora sp. TUW77]|uniref:HlyD family efflux transporter periplasmic adaptor subunit n=1 Tax=Phosphitispora sp. TUW77 TaxID=3152361 RepID=UPI003AB4353C